MADRTSSSIRTVIVVTLLAVLTFALFSRSLGYGFVSYDDPRYVTQNPHVHEGFTWGSWCWAFAGKGEMWNPLVRLTHILDWRIFGAWALGHHLHNILWHTLNAVLAFLLLRRLSGVFWLSAFCAALFAWHPLRVESVTWVSERKDVISVAFGLLTLLAYTSYASRRATPAPTAKRWFGLTLGAFIAALLSKPSMVVLPGLFLLLDFWPLRRIDVSDTASTPGRGPALPEAGRKPETLRRIFCEKIPFILFALVVAGINASAQIESGSVTLEVPILARLLNAIVSVPRYLGKFFWPFDLSVAYPHPIWWPAWGVLAAALFSLAFSWMAWRLRRSMPWLLIGWLWLWLALAPMSGIVQVGFQSMADRYTYFPIIGWEIALFWTLHPLVTSRWPKGIVTGAASLILVGAAMRTWDQQKYWSDSVRLFSHAIAVTENNAFAHKFLGIAYTGLNLPEEALKECRQALAIGPVTVDTLLICAEISRRLGRLDDAIADYRKVCALKPHDIDKACALGDTLLLTKRWDEAEKVYRDILQHVPVCSPAKYGLVKVALARNHPEEARAILAAALTEEPTNVQFLEQFALLLHQQGHDDAANRYFERALSSGPPSTTLLQLHAVFLFEAGKPAAAFAEFDRAIAREPSNAKLRFQYGQLLNEAGRYDEALASFAAARQLAPKRGAAAYEAAMIYLKQNNEAKAVELLRQAVTIQPDLVPANLALAQFAERASATTEVDACFQRALQADENNPEVHSLYAETLAKRQHYDEAAAHYRRASEIVPDNAAYHADYGYMLVLLGRSAEAVPEWETALRLDPTFPNLRAKLQTLQASRP